MRFTLLGVGCICTYVRMCTPLFHILGTVGRTVLKFGMFVDRDQLVQLTSLYAYLFTYVVHRPKGVLLVYTEVNEPASLGRIFTGQKPRDRFIN